jgi:hypothetical protein
MPIKPLLREISKPIENQGPISTGGFLGKRIKPSDWDKKYLKALYNFLPLKREKKEKIESNLPSTERQA